MTFDEWAYHELGYEPTHDTPLTRLLRQCWHSATLSVKRVKTAQHPQCPHRLEGSPLRMDNGGAVVRRRPEDDEAHEAEDQDAP